MSPSPQGSTSAGSQPLPPLPDLQSAQQTGGGQTGTPPDAMAAMIAGIAPVKKGVDVILQACKEIVQSGAVPGAEQPCGQIVALATSLLPMAAQAASMGGGGGAPAPSQGIPPVGQGGQ